jgi:galactose mutarotase-like enzyme
MRPERGGRIASLRLHGEELLDQGIGVDQPDADSFVAGGAWGWDEMVPNLEPTGRLPDHGEAWRLPWEVVEAGPDHVLTRCSGRLLPWRLERRLKLSPRSLRLSYVYSNPGSEPFLAYWCGHPLFRFEPSMKLSIAEGARLTSLPEGTSVKLHLPAGSLDHVTIEWASGLAVDLSWDPELTPYVGIWGCNGDLGGYRQIAIEPATGGNDRPDPACPPPLLAPGEALRWWLELSSVERQAL